MSVYGPGKRLFAGLVSVLVVLLALAACANVAAPLANEPTPSATVPAASPTVATDTATLTPAPTLSATPRPTATWVPLITPSATPGEKVLARADVPRIGVAEARAKVDAGKAILVDVRGDAVYALAHIAGAISLPAGDVSKRYGELPAGKLAIFYCA